MSIRTSQPPYLRKPAIVFFIGFLVYSAIVVGAFYMTSHWLPQSENWQPLLSAVPGIALCGIFFFCIYILDTTMNLLRE